MYCYLLSQAYSAISGWVPYRGRVGSICSWENVTYIMLRQLGEASISWPSRFELQVEPVAESVRVSLDGQRLDSGWWIERSPPTIVFVDPPSAGALVEIRYEVLQ